MTRILIAEDEPDIRELVMLTLQFAGFEVVTTNNGAELAERVASVMPDLILSDVRMPKMTGYEACKIIKADPACAEIPFIFLSAKGQEDEVRSGLESGAAAYILKPFAPDELVRRVKEILEQAAAGTLQPQPVPAKHSAPPPTVEATPHTLDKFGTKPLNPKISQS